MTKFPRLALLFSLLAVSLLSGCVVAEKNGRVTGVGLDYAEIFGTTVGTFKLADGTDGTLRRDTEGKFSVKLQKYHKMVPVAQNAVSARVAQVTELAGRTSVLVEFADKRCKYNYQLLSVAGSQVSSWTFGSCNDRPRVFVYNDQQFFDFPDGRHLKRFRLSGDEVRSARLLPPDGYPAFTEPFANESLQMPEDDLAQEHSGDGNTRPLMRNGRVIPRPPISVGASAATAAPASSPSSPGASAAVPAAMRQPARKPDEPVVARKARPSGSRSGAVQPDLVFDEPVRPVRVVDLR